LKGENNAVWLRYGRYLRAILFSKDDWHLKNVVIEKSNKSLEQIEMERHTRRPNSKNRSTAGEIGKPNLSVRVASINIENQSMK
jgi:hypothetical protein